MKNVVLIGFKGSGKTAVGKPLAIALGLQFVDLDDLIVECHGQSENTVRSIFKTHGEAYFRAMESKALRSLVGEIGKVIATGGGTPVDEGNRDCISNAGVVVYLDVPKSKLFARIKNKGFPPFFDKKKPELSFERFYKERKDIYSNIADITMKLKHEKISDIVKKIEEELKKNHG